MKPRSHKSGNSSRGNSAVVVHLHKCPSTGVGVFLCRFYTRTHPVGYKFEVLSLLDKPLADCTRDEVENRDNVVVNNNAQYCSIIKTGMGSTSLILGGEVDGGQFCPKYRACQA